MLTAEQREEIEYIEDRMLAKFPLLGVMVSKLEVVADDAVRTAMTTGDKIYYSPEFFKKLSDDEAIFIFAHEVFHVAFEHIARSQGRDSNLWNIATDAVINQILAKEGLPIKEGLVNIPEAQGLSAEEMYDKLLESRQKKEKEWQEHVQEMMNKAKEMAEQQRQKQTEEKQSNQDEEQTAGQPEGSSSPQTESDKTEENCGENTQQPDSEMPQDFANEEKPGQAENDSGDEKQEADDTQGNSLDEWANQPPQMPEFPEFKFKLPNHEIWKEAVEQMNEQQQGESTDLADMEKDFLQKNKREQIKQEMQYFQDYDAYDDSKSERTGTFHVSSGELEDKKVKKTDWKKILKKSLDQEIERWSSRRADEDNDYMSRLEEEESEDKVHTEVMLDVSGSVDVDLLKEFLRQLKPLLKESTIAVGYFNDRTTDYTLIKTVKDIEKLDIPNPYGGTNLDAAVRSFSENKRTNKIIFTDGEGIMPREDLKKAKVIWMIYGNHRCDFSPCCGRVIYVDENEMMAERRNRNYLIDGMRQNQGK